MSTSEQRKQWADHIADEGRALQDQQRSAGATHSPTEGPLPYTADDVAAAVRAAVAAERERCAAIADRWGTESNLLRNFADFTEWELRAGLATARAVATEIRGERQSWAGTAPPSHCE